MRFIVGPVIGPVIGRVLVHGASMAPTLRHGDQLAVLRRRTARPGQLVVVRLPEPAGGLGVKRLIRVVDGGALWIEGDNPFGSTDSRSYGPVPAEALVGVAIARIWPRPRLLRSVPAPARAISS